EKASRLTPATVLALIILLAFLVLAWLSIAQYRGYNQDSRDMARMSQAIWGVTHGQPLISTVDGVEWSRLANHVEIAYLLLAPAYALWPSPILLLLIQAALFVSGAVPVFRLARRHLGARP